MLAIVVVRRPQKQIYQLQLAYNLNHKNWVEASNRARSLEETHIGAYTEDRFVPVGHSGQLLCQTTLFVIDATNPLGLHLKSNITPDQVWGQRREFCSLTGESSTWVNPDHACFILSSSSRPLITECSGTKISLHFSLVDCLFQVNGIVRTPTTRLPGERCSMKEWKVVKGWQKPWQPCKVSVNCESNKMEDRHMIPRAPPIQHSLSWGNCVLPQGRTGQDKEYWSSFLL